MLSTTVSQILLFSLVGFVLGGTLLILSTVIQRVFGIYSPNPQKEEPYECGMKTFHDTKIQFDIKYYLYALMFIVFDVEFVFLVPWATIMRLVENKMFLVVEAFIFVFILILGLFYAWKKGVLEFE